MSNPVVENNTEWGNARGDVDAIDAAAKKLSKPLWVIAICSAISTLIFLLMVGYAGITYIQFASAMSDLGTETSQTPGEESKGANQDVPTSEGDCTPEPGLYDC